MGYLLLPEAKLYWSRTISISNRTTWNKFYEIRNHSHFLNNLLDKEPKWQNLECTIASVCCTWGTSDITTIHSSFYRWADDPVFWKMCYVQPEPNPLEVKKIILAAYDDLLLDYKIYTRKGTVTEESETIIRFMTGHFHCTNCMWKCSSK